jgi:hypothetical protein
MLTPALWDALGLDPEVLERRGSFFSMYVESLTQVLDPEVDDLIRRAELGGLRRDGDGEVEGDAPLTWLEAPQLDDGEPGGFSAERPLDSRSAMGHAVQADALREAALATLPLDVQRGLYLLRESGHAYADAEMPYAQFLTALADPGEENADMAAQTLARAWPEPSGLEWMARMERPLDDPDFSPADYQPPLLDGLTTAARDPAQQLYLALAACQTPRSARERGELLGRVYAQPLGRSTIPFGTTGIALTDWWRLVSEMSALGRAGEEAREGLRARLRFFAVEHGRQLAYAQRTAGWSEGRAPVDIVDLDVAGATCLAVRLMRPAGLRPLDEDDFADLDPLAIVSLAIGLSIARGDDEPEGAFGEFVIDGGPSSGDSAEPHDTRDFPAPAPSPELGLG